jgi:hypothetical protein
VLVLRPVPAAGAFEGLLGFLLRRKRGRFIKLITAQGGVSEYRYRVWLHFEHAAGDVERLFLTFFVLHANFAWL